MSCSLSRAEVYRRRRRKRSSLIIAKNDLERHAHTLWNGEGEVLGVVPLLCAQGSEEEAQVGLVAPEDVGPAGQHLKPKR